LTRRKRHKDQLSIIIINIIIIIIMITSTAAVVATTERCLTLYRHYQDVVKIINKQM